LKKRNHDDLSEKNIEWKQKKRPRSTLAWGRFRVYSWLYDTNMLQKSFPEKQEQTNGRNWR